MEVSRSQTLAQVRPGLTTRCVLVGYLLLVSVLSSAQTYTQLSQFNGANGGTPIAPLVQGFNGDLYGTAEFVGSHGGSNFGGTAFDITTGGTLTALYDFCVGGSGNCTDGYNPVAVLARDSSGNFYGTATSGGAHGPFQAYGTVFKLTSGGTFTRLYSFCAIGGCADGTNPNGGVTLASNGNLYGTTVSGGTGSGTVFKVTTGGTLTTLHDFCSLANCSDGSQPQAGLIQASDGNFYGTTYFAGKNSKGTVFKITASGTLTTLYPFCSLSSCVDGAQPYAKLLQGADGSLYGTTASGGKFNKGTIFKITPAGKLTTLYSFCTLASCADGQTPLGALIQATDGNLYGTTFLGGAKNQGTIFRFKLPATLTTLYSFCKQAGCSDGANPIAGLMQDTNGEFYGTAIDGGSTAFNCDGAGNGGTAAGCGTVFSLSVGLNPFISLLSTSGTVGSKVSILGQDFDSTSVVKFNGVAAVSKTLTGTTYIVATVPAGATDGYVTVTTGSTTLRSTQKYTVHNSWASGKAMPVALFAPAATGVINNKIYVVGGFTTTSVIANNQIYNPATNSWSAGAAIPTTTADGATAVVSNILYVFGGSQDGTTVTNAVWAYNPVTNTWSSKAAMPTARASAAAAVKNNIIYVIGGTDGVNRFSIVESYNPATNTWTTKAPLLVGKSEASVGLVGTTIVAADGYTSSMDTGDNEGYNTSTNTWSALTSDRTPRHEACTGSTGSALYLAGGSNNNGTSLSLTESFSVTSNKWTTLTSMPLAATFPGSAMDAGVLYCFGGSDRNSQFQGTVYNYVQIYQP